MSTNVLTLSQLCQRVREFIRAPRADDFNALALDLFQFQFIANPGYRAFCERSGASPAEVRSWEKIPAMVTSAFKDLELSTISPTDRSTVFHSSGTTEHRPSRHFHSRETLGVYDDSWRAWFKPHLLPDGDRATFLVLAPPASEVPHSSLAHMFTGILEKFGTLASSYAGEAAKVGWTVDFSKIGVPTRPVIICGTAFSFVHWCDYLAEHRMKLVFPSGSRVLETGGYKGRSRTVAKADLHALIADYLGIPPSGIISEYGMSELSSQAYDRVAGTPGPGVFKFPPWARARVLSPESLREVPEGGTGLVRVVDLANAGSVMVVQTEDLAIRRGEGFELLGRAAMAEPRGCSLLELRS